MHTDPLANLETLLRCRSVTPDEGGALDALEAMLAPLGFAVERPVFSDRDTPDVENLYARFGGGGPHLMFAGHTDVVPAGNEADWTRPPFAGEVVEGEMIGRGAVDMKGAIACFVAAVARYLAGEEKPAGSISLLIAGDEEGPSLNGTVKLLQKAAADGERWDAAIVGEPTSGERLGDTVKIGRRGSLSGTLTIDGVQGHVAYPHRADNPVASLMALLPALTDPPLDTGSDTFPPTNLEVTTIDVGNTATNVIPARATASFNVRFNDLWTAETLRENLLSRLETAARSLKRQSPLTYDVTWRRQPSPVFVTRNAHLIETLSACVEAVIGVSPALSTTGGTSDARFIKDYCPVVEFGLVGATMHMIDERVSTDDLEALTQIYGAFLKRWFA